MELKLCVAAEKIKTIELFAARKDPRKYINAINFEIGPAEYRMVATDGHMMGCWRVECERGDITEPLTNLIVPIELFGQVKPKGWVEITFGEPDPENDKNGNSRPVNVMYEGLTMRGNTVGWHKYPEWRRCVPATTSGVPGQFDICLLARLEKLGRLLSSSNKWIRDIAISHNGPNNAALIDAGEPDFVGVIMPRAIYDNKRLPLTAPPAWVSDCSLGAYPEPAVPAPVADAAKEVIAKAAGATGTPAVQAHVQEDEQACA